MCDAIIEGIETNLFDVVAHPDRAFRRRKNFGESERKQALRLIDTAARNGVYLEKNFASQHRKRQYWTEFWELLPPEAKTVYGLDAHYLKDLVAGMKGKGQIDISIRI